MTLNKCSGIKLLRRKILLQFYLEMQGVSEPVPLLLARFSDNLLSVQVCNRILLATFRYIKKSQREL